MLGELSKFYTFTKTVFSEYFSGDTKISLLYPPTFRNTSMILNTSPSSDVFAGFFLGCFVASRQALLNNDELLRKKLLLAMWEGPYFAKAVANVIGMDPGPLPEVPTLPKEAPDGEGFV